MKRLMCWLGFMIGVRLIGMSGRAMSLLGWYGVAASVVQYN
jgi:hypothetical protein